jgi:hypothetical protein
MGFRKPNLTPARQAIGQSLAEIHSSFNDGYTQMSCKQELYLLKCWLDTEYKRLPTFTGEEKWEQERLIQVLKQE